MKNAQAILLQNNSTLQVSLLGKKWRSKIAFVNYL